METKEAAKYSEGALRVALALGYLPDTAAGLAEIISRETGDLKLREQNTELLEALKQSLRLPTLLVRSYEDVDGSHQSAKTARQFDERYRALRAQIEAVIAKVEKQP